MKREFRLYLDDILESIVLIEEFTAYMDFDQFFTDEKTKNAVVKRIEIIGEATKNIPKNIRDKYPDLPWKQMARMRDKLSHEYFGIRYDIVWKVVKKRLPEIKLHIKRILKDIEAKQK